MEDLHSGEASDAADGPHVAGRRTRDAVERGERSGRWARNDLPARAVEVLDQVPVATVAKVTYGPDVVGRDRRHGVKCSPSRRRRGSNDAPGRAVEVFDQRLRNRLAEAVDGEVDTDRPHVVAGHGGHTLELRSDGPRRVGCGNYSPARAVEVLGQRRVSAVDGAGETDRPDVAVGN